MDTICGLFKLISTRHGCDVAVCDEKQRLTYAELDRLVDYIWVEFPMGSPRFMGIVMDYTVEMITAIFAVVKSGGAYVAGEPSLPEGRIRFMMRDSGVDFVIANSSYLRYGLG